VPEAHVFVAIALENLAFFCECGGVKYAPIYADREETFTAFGRHVSPGEVATCREYGFDVVMGRREGVFPRDAFDGRRFFNCHSNGGVLNLGHRHSGVIAAYPFLRSGAIER
jgi:4-aminobutyrate aminotransferase-like enzyme